MVEVPLRSFVCAEKWYNVLEWKPNIEQQPPNRKIKRRTTYGNESK
jgi:hypothetical protein